MWSPPELLQHKIALCGCTCRMNCRFLLPRRLVIPLADQASPDSERPRALLQVGGSGDWLQLPSHVVVMGSRITGACPCAATVRVSAGMQQGG